MSLPPPVRFTEEDANRAYDEWGAHCGPGAIAAVTGKTLEELRPHLGDFEKKRYTNPTLMWRILRNVGVKWWRSGEQGFWPSFGLVRIQWEGPWTDQGVPMAARYRHTHWVASCLSDSDMYVFDINCMCVGGWVHFSEWDEKVVPWLLRECEPKASGRWHSTHDALIERPHV